MNPVSKQDKSTAQETAFALLLAALVSFVLVSQFFRRMPHFFDYAKGLLSADALVYPDLMIQLSSGQAGLADWISNPAPFWLTHFFPVMALMEITDGNWRLSMSLRRAVEALALIGSLACVIRAASGMSVARSFIHAALSTALLVAVDHAFGGPLTMTLGNSGHRTFNIAVFLLACAGLAKVASSGSAFHPLSWLYVALCLLLGLEDALLAVHVVAPVVMAALLWALAGPADGRKRWGLVLAALLGAAAFAAGFLLNLAALPFVRNETLLVDSSLGFDPSRSFADGLGPLAAVLLTLEGASHVFLESVAEEWWGENSLNALLLVFVAPVAYWTLASRPGAASGVSPERSMQECARFFLKAMFWSALLVTMAAVTVHTRARYSYMLLWAAPLVAATALACRDDSGAMHLRWLRNAAFGAAAMFLVLQALFFRPELVVSERARCSAVSGVLEGTGLDRGMVSFWNSREALVMSGRKTMHLVYLGVGQDQGGSLSFWFPQVGNVSHIEGKADYASIDLRDNPGGISGVRGQFGLPARAEECGNEAWYLYEAGWISSDDLIKARYQW